MFDIERPTTKRILGETAAIGVAGLITYGMDYAAAHQLIQVPDFMVHRMHDYVGGIFYSSVSRLFLERRKSHVIAGFVQPSIQEIAQGARLWHGTYDFPGDFIAYGLGAVTFGVLDRLRERWSQRSMNRFSDKFALFQ